MANEKKVINNRIMFGCSMPPSIFNELTAAAERLDMSRSQLISLICKAWLISQRGVENNEIGK